MKKAIIATAIVLMVALGSYVTVFGASIGWPKLTPSYLQEIPMTAKQFGIYPKEVAVTAGRPVRLVVNSIDVDHGIIIKGIDAKVMKSGRKTTLEFTPTVPGRYEFECALACGLGHDEMRGTLVVQETLVKSVK